MILNMYVTCRESIWNEWRRKWKFSVQQSTTAYIRWGGLRWGEPSKRIFWRKKNFFGGIFPNQVHPPPSPKVGTPKTKKNDFFCIVGIIFFYDSSHLWTVPKKIGIGRPPEAPLPWLGQIVFSPISDLRAPLIVTITITLDHEIDSACYATFRNFILDLYATLNMHLELRSTFTCSHCGYHRYLTKLYIHWQCSYVG